MSCVRVSDLLCALVVPYCDPLQSTSNFVMSKMSTADNSIHYTGIKPTSRDLLQERTFSHLLPIGGSNPQRRQVSCLKANQQNIETPLMSIKLQLHMDTSKLWYNGIQRWCRSSTIVGSWFIFKQMMCLKGLTDQI